MHRLLFSFLICTAIQRHDAVIAPQAWDFFLRGVSRTPDQPKPLSAELGAWMGTVTWQAVQAVER